jgi:predicted HTH transcriptional regulator
LTPDSLREDHASVPNNPLIADPMYLARYIEKAGTGTQLMISLCRDAGLPEPDFEERSGSIVVTLWRNWITDELLAGMGLSDRQMQAVRHTRTAGRITNAQFRTLTGASESSALRELRQLSALGVFQRVGATGRSTAYMLANSKPATKPSEPSAKPVINPPNPSSKSET